MTRDSFDIYDELPDDMYIYLKYNGRHFNRRLVAFAISKMTTRDNSGNEVPLAEITKDKLKELLSSNGIKIDEELIYDALFVANMGKADYLGSSIPDENHLAKYVNDVINDIDGYDGLPFNRWYADMIHKGIPIDWYEYR